MVTIQMPPKRPKTTAVNFPTALSFECTLIQLSECSFYMNYRNCRLVLNNYLTLEPSMRQ